MMRQPLRSLAVLALFACGSILLAQPAVNLVTNGDFQTDANQDGIPDGWSKAPGVSLVTEDGNRWVRIDHSQTTQNVALPPDAWEIRLTMRMKATDVVMGAESWQDARLAMSFHNAKGDRVGDWPNVFHATGTTDWTDCDRTYRVPTDATRLNLGAAVFGPKGVLELDSLKIVVTRLRSTQKNDEPLPAGVTNVWQMDNAWRVKTPTRERICLNGLWQFRPVAEESEVERVPGVNDCWGWFPVPGIWTSQSTPDLWTQPLTLSPWIEERIKLANLDRAWTKRTFTVPADWSGRRVWFEATMVQTHAAVFVDNKKAGEIWFPGGRLDLSDFIRPGQEQTLAVLITARPLENDSEVFMAPDRIIKNKASVKLKGLTGDVYLVSEPVAEAVEGVQVITSYRESRIDFAVELRDPGQGQRRLMAQIRDGGRVVKTINSDLLAAGSELTFGDSWRDPKLWDTDATGNLYTVAISLLDERGRVLDELEPVTFGFREFWIEGRDFLLNGSPIHLRALYVGNANYPADSSSFAACRNTMERMQQYGFNFFIFGNYNFSPGEVGYMDGLLDAADQTGTLCSFSLPHIKDFSMKLDQPEQRARYEALTRWLVRRVRNHPAMVLYAMNHNATGYHGDQNPLKMDGIYQPENYGKQTKSREQAVLAADIAKSIDPTRPVYHHQSGNLGDMHTVNIYLNWAPPQERDDWLGHWEAEGAKPMFFVEWGLPHISSWSSYRGPQFIWRCEAYQSLWDSEFAAPFIGERAYEMTEQKQKSLAHEENLWAKGEPFAWSNLNRYLHGTEECFIEINTRFADTNWRSHRAHGVSAMLPWDQGEFWRRVVPGKPRTLAWQDQNLQQPGIVAAIDNPGSQYIFDDGPESDYEPSSSGRSFLRWNMPLCAFIGGGEDGFTEKSHNLLPGDKVGKQFVVLNDTRRPRTCRVAWTSPFGMGSENIQVAPGLRALEPVKLRVPKDAKPGEYRLEATFTFDEGTVQTDAFAFHVLAPATPVETGRVALFDPAGDTAKLLRALDLRYRKVDAGDSLADTDLLVIGRGALTNAPALPGLAKLREGLRVLVFEQDADTLRDRLGFRVNIHGLRQVYPRIPGHPAFAGLTADNLHDWRGDATLVPPYLTDLPDVETGYAAWDWCGFRNTRVWRCGNRGALASVLIEKPCRGNWTALADGGFDLQYAPLLEGVFGQGRILFCQLDVTARSESDPAAEQLCRNLVAYLQTAPPPAYQPVAASGQALSLAQELGVAVVADSSLLLLGPDSDLAQAKTKIEQGATALALGLNAEQIGQLAPGAKASQVSAYSTLADFSAPEFVGLSDAELHWRTKLDFAAIDATGPGNAALRVATVGKGRVVLCQVAPWMLDAEAKPYLRTSLRRNLFLMSRLLTNLGARLDSPLPELITAPAKVSTVPLEDGWRGLVDKEDQGTKQEWFQPGFDDSVWGPIKTGATFESQLPELAEYDGVFWYRLRFTVPASVQSDPEITLHIGPVDDESTVWLNGALLGEVNPKTNPKDYWSFPREYRLKAGELLPGENVVAVRVVDTYRSGGMMGQPRLFVPAVWLRSHYVQVPQSVDDPYRYYRW